jgi:hypothetical protein
MSELVNASRVPWSVGANRNTRVAKRDAASKRMRIVAHMNTAITTTRSGVMV